MRDASNLDLNFKNVVAERAGAERITNCFMCGTCTATCPVSALNGEYNPRRIIKMVLLGMKEEVLSSPQLWQCNQCHACVAHCPQNVSFADVMRVIRQLAIEEGYFTKEYAAEIEKIDIETRQLRIDRINNLKAI